MKQFVTLSLIFLLASCGGDDNTATENQEPLIYEKSGTLTITIPRDHMSDFNVDYLAPALPLPMHSPLPSNVDVDFTVNSDQITSPNGLIHVTQDTLSLDNALQFPEIEAPEDIAIEVFGTMILPPQNTDLENSASLQSSETMIIYVNSNRAVALTKVGTYIGGYTREHFVWALYTRP